MNFGSLLRKYRFKAGFHSLSDLSDELLLKGYSYENSVLSRWQTGTRIPRERKLLLALVAIFLEHHAMQTADEINNLLDSADQGYLTSSELRLLFKNEKYKSLYSFLPVSMQEVESIFTSLSMRKPSIADEQKLDSIENELNRLYAHMYNGFTISVYHAVSNIILILTIKV